MPPLRIHSLSADPNLSTSSATFSRASGSSSDTSLHPSFVVSRCRSFFAFGSIACHVRAQELWRAFWRKSFTKVEKLAILWEDQLNEIEHARVEHVMKQRSSTYY